VAHVDGVAREAKIFLAARLAQQDIKEHFHELLHERERVEWDTKAQAVFVRRRVELGALVIEDRAAEGTSPEGVTTALLQGIREAGLDCLPWTEALRQWQGRVLFLRRVLGEAWPEVSDAALLASLETWLAPYLVGMSRLSHLERLQLDKSLAALLDHRQRGALDEQAPSHVTVPSGSQLRLDYASGETPVLKVRLQEVFGLADTPRLAGGKVPVMLHLLSPAQRPVQMTQDLKGFWQRTWPEVKKEMKGRYPKHHWPEDPLQTPATRGGRKPRPAQPKR
jgi:ATP-dependent helicase HrpB